MCTHMKRAFGIRMTEGGVSLILYTFTKNDRKTVDQYFTVTQYCANVHDNPYFFIFC